MRFRWSWSVLLTLAALAAGCKPQQFHAAGNDVLEAPAGTLSVFHLAGRLGLDVVDPTASSVFLRDQANTILIYPDPDGRAYVNGQPVGPAGGFVYVGDTLFVPAAAEEHIRQAMRQQRARPAPAAAYVRPPVRPPRPRPTRRRVLIDPGHGGKDPGATSCLGFYEKVVNLAVAREVARGLTARGVEARLTRDDDRFIELNDRAACANKIRADVFVSVHADHCPRPSVRGFSVYVARQASKPSLALAAAVAAALARTGMQDRGVRKADFRVLVRTRCPAVLIELGYLSNPRDSVLLIDGRFQKRLAAAIADGVAAYLAKR